MATYSFLDVVATLVGPGGAVTLGSDAGVAEEGLTSEMSEDKNTMTIGADGTPMHSLHAGQGGLITVRLLKTSPINAMLQMMYDVQTAQSVLHGQNHITITDIMRGDVVSGSQCAFKKFTGLTYAKDAGMNEWAFDVGILKPVLGSGIFNAGLSINLNFGLNIGGLGLGVDLNL